MCDNSNLKFSVSQLPCKVMGFICFVFVVFFFKLSVLELRQSAMVLGDLLQFSPAVSHLLGVGLQVPLPGVQRSSSLFLSLGVPGQGPSGHVIVWVP